jgi:hypothetical protein
MPHGNAEKLQGLLASPPDPLNASSALIRRELTNIHYRSDSNVSSMLAS